MPVGKSLVVRAKLDVAGAITVTASLMLAVYAIVHGNEVGWPLRKRLPNWVLQSRS